MAKDKTRKAVSHDHMPKAKFKKGDTLRLTRPVNGTDPGHKVEVLDVQFDGAVFICKMLTGPIHGQTVRIAAPDLKK